MSRLQKIPSLYFCLTVALQCPHTLAFSTFRHCQWQREASIFSQSGSVPYYPSDASAIMDFPRSTQHQPSPYQTTTALSFSADIAVLAPPSGLSISLVLLPAATNPTYDGARRRRPMLCRLPRAPSPQRPKAHKKKLLHTTTPVWEHPRCPPSPRPSTS